MKSPCYQITNTVITLKLYIQPGSKKNEVIGLFEGSLKIKLATQPIEGQANLALIKYLSQLLKSLRRNPQAFLLLENDKASII